MSEEQRIEDRASRAPPPPQGRVVARTVQIQASETLDLHTGYAREGWHDFLWLSGWRARIAVFVLKALPRGEKLAVTSAAPPLTVIEVAAELTVSERTVWRLIASGALGHNRFAGCVRVSRDDLDDYRRRTHWPSSRGQTPRGDTGTGSSSSSVNIVFSDGSRPARRKPRPTRSKSSGAAN
jgi:excisionase family DNA binding protein